MQGCRLLGVDSELPNGGGSQSERQLFHHGGANSWWAALGTSARCPNRLTSLSLFLYELMCTLFWDCVSVSGPVCNLYNRPFLIKTARSPIMLFSIHRGRRAKSLKRRGEDNTPSVRKSGPTCSLKYIKLAISKLNSLTLHWIFISTPLPKKLQIINVILLAERANRLASIQIWEIN